MFLESLYELDTAWSSGNPSDSFSRNICPPSYQDLSLSLSEEPNLLLIQNEGRTLLA